MERKHVIQAQEEKEQHEEAESSDPVHLDVVIVDDRLRARSSGEGSEEQYKDALHWNYISALRNR